MAALSDVSLDIGTDLKDVYLAGSRGFLAQVKIPAADEVFGRVSERAVAYAAERGAELVSGLDETTRRLVANDVAAGLADNLGLDDIASRLLDGYAFSDDRADLIARTEVARANSQGTLEGMRGARAAGVKIKKVWLPDEAACDECLGNGDAGPIGLDEDFPSGDDAPPAHPNCRCDMASDIDEGEDKDDDEPDDSEA